MENQYLDGNLDQEKTAYSGYGSFLRRLAAALIDGILLSVVSQILQSVWKALLAAVSVLKPKFAGRTMRIFEVVCCLTIFLLVKRRRGYKPRRR